VARRYRYDYDYYEFKERVKTDQGIKARSRRGKIGQSWWAEQWIQALERLVDAGRLRRGRSYARSGQVLSLEEEAGIILAKVQGSRRTPYKVTIGLSTLTDTQWEQVIDQMAAQAGFTAQLLAGEMPPDIEEAFTAAGVSLFPERGDDLATDCNCPDWANPCKHVAATHYILGEQFDEDPFMIFRLRGRTQEQILEALRARRADDAEEAADETFEEEPETVVPLEELMQNYWQPLEHLDTLSTTIKPPAVRLPLLKRLGRAAFLPNNDLSQLLAPTYEQITKAALAAAFDDDHQYDDGDRTA